jgi:hypothetical protein
VVLEVRERPAARTDDEEEDGSPRRWPETRAPFAIATASTITELVALRLRLSSLARRADRALADAARLRAPASHAQELRDAREFLAGAAARARVQGRFANTAAEALAHALSRGAQ